MKKDKILAKFWLKNLAKFVKILTGKCTKNCTKNCIKNIYKNAKNKLKFWGGAGKVQRKKEPPKASGKRWTFTVRAPKLRREFTCRRRQIGVDTCM